MLTKYWALKFLDSNGWCLLWLWTKYCENRCTYYTGLRFRFFPPTDEFPIDLGSFLYAEFKNDIRFNVFLEIIYLKCRKIEYFFQFWRLII